MTTRQDVQGQRLAILECARRHSLQIDEFVEATASAMTLPKRRLLDDLMSTLESGVRLVVSELSRLGRSLGQIVAMLDTLAREGMAFIAIKEQVRIEGKQGIRTKVMATLFASFAEVERDLISERIREGPTKTRSSGKKLGRSKGSLGVSHLDGQKAEIRRFFRLGVSKNPIAKVTGVSRPTLYHFIDSRGLYGPVLSVQNYKNRAGAFIIIRFPYPALVNVYLQFSMRK